MRRAAALVAFGLTGTPPLGAAHGESYVLAAGNPGGVYLSVAHGLAEAGRDSGLDLRVTVSEGSRQNLSWLSAGKADFALAQGDTVFAAYHGLGSFPAPVRDLRAIASLYTEAVHVLVRRPLYVHGVEDFRGKRISIGLPGSGAEGTARALLEVAGITESEASIRRLSTERALAALRRQEVDVVVLTSGIPSSAVVSALRDGSASLFEPGAKLLERLLATCPFFLVTSIPAGTYPGQAESVETAGVAAMLVGRGSLPDDAVYRLTEALFSHPGLVAPYRRAQGALSLGRATAGVTIPTFEGSTRYFAARGLRRWRLIRRLGDAILGLTLAATLAVAVRRRRTILRFFGRHDLARVFFFFLVLWTLGSFALYLAEHRINDSYSSLVKSFWSGIITIMSLAAEPFTLAGRGIAITMMILGLGGVAWLTGNIASIYVHKKILGGAARMDRISDHYVIANWNEKGYGILEQLHGGDFGHDTPILIVTDRADRVVLPEPGDFHSVYIVKGDPTSESVLRRANVHKAHSVVVLADDVNDPGSDAKTILIILTLRKICLEQKVPQVPKIAEILDPQKVRLATYAGLEGAESVEIVSSQELGQRLLSQAAVHPGLTEVYRRLLTFGKDSSEIHRMEVPEWMAGWSFENLLRSTSALRAQGVRVIPVGVLRDGKLDLNPSDDEIGPLRRGDFLFAICDGPHELQRLQRERGAAEASEDPQRRSA